MLRHSSRPALAKVRNNPKKTRNTRTTKKHVAHALTPSIRHLTSNVNVQDHHNQAINNQTINTQSPSVASKKKLPLTLADFTPDPKAPREERLKQAFRPTMQYVADGVFAHHGWNVDDISKVQVVHRKPENFGDRLAVTAVNILRKGFDLVSGYRLPPIGEENNPKYMLSQKTWMARVIFLESVAAVPGLAGAMARHLMSIRKFKRDQGWWDVLIEESANERMHLMCLLDFYKPGFIMKSGVLIAQGVMMNAFFLAYLVQPRLCHRWVGFLEEQAVKTYTHYLHELDMGWHAHATDPAPEIAKKYWKMSDKATFREMINYIRADEVVHCSVNHTLANLNQESDPNPFVLRYPTDSPFINPSLHDFKAHLSHPLGWERHEIDVSGCIHPDLAKKIGVEVNPNVPSDNHVKW